MRFMIVLPLWCRDKREYNTTRNKLDFLLGYSSNIKIFKNKQKRNQTEEKKTLTFAFFTAHPEKKVIELNRLQ